MWRLLVRGTFVYGTVRAFNRAIPYLLLPYLTLYLSPEEFGSLALFRSSLGIVTLLVGVSTSSALNRYFFELPTVEIAAWTYGSLALTACNAALITACLFFLKDQLSGWLGIDAFVLLTVPTVAFGYCALMLALDRWRHQMLFWRYAGLNVAQTLVDVGFTLFLVVMLGWGVLGRILGLGLSYISVGAIGVALLYGAGQICFQGKRTDYKRMLSFSAPLIPYALGAWALISVDRYFLNSLVGPAQTGIYSVGFLFGSIIVVLQEIIAQAWGPVVFRAMSDNDRAKRKQLLQLYLALVIGFISIGLILSFAVPRLMVFFVGDAFTPAAAVVPWITWAFVLNAMRAFLVHFIQFAKKNHLLMMSTLIPAAAHIAISYSLITIDGALGAAKALSISMTIALLVTIVMARESIRLRV